MGKIIEEKIIFPIIKVSIIISYVFVLIMGALGIKNSRMLSRLNSLID